MVVSTLYSLSKKKLYSHFGSTHPGLLDIKPRGQEEMLDVNDLNLMSNIVNCLTLKAHLLGVNKIYLTRLVGPILSKKLESQNAASVTASL